MKSFTEYVNESYLIEGFTPEMKKVFTKAELANAGRAISTNYEFNLEKTSFKEVDASVINKNAKSLDKKVVLVKTSDGAYLIKYQAGANHPILSYDLGANTKRAYWGVWDMAKAGISRKDMAKNAMRVFVSTDEVFDRYDIHKEREANQPEPEKTPGEARRDLKDRLAMAKIDKEKASFLLDPKKSYTENAELLADKVKKYLCDYIMKTSLLTLEYGGADKIKRLAGDAHSYGSYLEDLEKGEITDYTTKTAKRYFDRVMKEIDK